MHEWGMVRALVKEIERAAARNGADKVFAAKIKIRRDMWRSPEHLRDQFGIVSAGTVAEGANLVIEYLDDRQAQQIKGILLENMEIDA